MIIGIDLGTTNSAIAYVNESGNPEIINNREGDRVTPSVILFEGESPIIGQIAKDCAVSDPLNVVQFVKRQMANKKYKFITKDEIEYTSEELSAIILKKLKEDAESYLGEKIEKAVVTVPAYFDDATRKATYDAGKIIGLDIVKIINEPTAAAIAYGITKNRSEQNILVYDLGGGTFDVTLIEITNQKITIKATSGDKNLGGFDFDNTIINYVIEKFNEKYDIDLYEDDIAMQDLREKAEICKKQLSSRQKSMITINSQGKVIREEITRTMFEEWINPILDKTDIIIEQVVEDAAYSYGQIGKVLLIGGSTRMPIVSERIKKLMGIEPSLEINPDEAVAFGAAIQAVMLDKEYEQKNNKYKDLEIIDVNSHSIGIECRDTERDIEINSIILEKNSPIPSSNKKIYCTSMKNQQAIELKVTEGEDEDLNYVRIVGTSDIDLPKGLAKETPLEIEIALDENQIIHCFARLEEDGRYLGEMHIQRNDNLSNDEIEKMKDKITKLTIS